MPLMQMFFQCLSTLLTRLVLANVLVAVLTVRNMRRCRVELHMNSMLFFNVMNDSRTVAKIAIALRTRWHICTAARVNYNMLSGLSLLFRVQVVRLPSRRLHLALIDNGFSSSEPEISLLSSRGRVPDRPRCADDLARSRAGCRYGCRHRWRYRDHTW